MSDIATGDMQALVDTIEAGNAVQLEFPTYAEALRILSCIRSKLYRERSKVSAIMDAAFEPFSFTLLPTDPDSSESQWLLTLRLNPVTKPMYAWKVVD